MENGLDAFISRVEGFSSLTPAVQNEHLAYYLHSIGKPALTAKEIDALRIQLKLPPFNTATRLSVESRASRGKKGSQRFVKANRGYFLERSVFEELESKFGNRPSAVVIKHGLTKHLATVSDPALKEYLQEAINCFEHGFSRAAIVLGWCSAYAVFRRWLFLNHLPAVNSAMASWRTPKTITRIEEFDELNERVVIDTARAAGAVTKEQQKQLIMLLDQRNSFAHPTGRKASAPIAEAYLTQVIDEVLVNFT